jgi:hypothetical protein
MKTKDPAEADAKLIIDMYEYALTNNLDITNKNDVISILKALGQENVANDRIERLMMALAVTAQRIRTDVGQRKKQIN